MLGFIEDQPRMLILRIYNIHTAEKISTSDVKTFDEHLLLALK